ncbi:hypothetical protein PM082_010307 [Marasmius tenuissimus]|nr:hypothetical protein PM082_010307 [Marasmius tenuissimus]
MMPTSVPLESFDHEFSSWASFKSRPGIVRTVDVYRLVAVNVISEPDIFPQSRLVADFEEPVPPSDKTESDTSSWIGLNHHSFVLLSVHTQEIVHPSTGSYQFKQVWTTIVVGFIPWAIGIGNGDCACAFTIEIRRQSCASPDDAQSRHPMCHSNSARMSNNCGQEFTQEDDEIAATATFMCLPQSRKQWLANLGPSSQITGSVLLGLSLANFAMLEVISECEICGTP